MSDAGEYRKSCPARVYIEWRQNNIFEIRIKSDFCKHKTVKTNDKIRRFGVVITPLSRKSIYQIMQITAFKTILAQRINKQGIL